MVNKGKKKIVARGQHSSKGGRANKRKPISKAHPRRPRVAAELEPPNADAEHLLEATAASIRSRSMGGAAANDDGDREFFRVLQALRWSCILVGNSVFRRLITPQSFKRLMVKINATVRKHIAEDEKAEHRMVIEDGQIGSLIENHHIQHGREAKF